MSRLIVAPPAIFQFLRGYGPADFRADAFAGLTVGVIALPLAIGFGIASGVTPAQGLWTAIIAGLVVAIFGGSRFQIAGPTGAFVPVLLAVVISHGVGGLLAATFLAGLLLLAMGLTGMGSALKYIPFPVVAGFTTGIAVIIFLSQLPAFFGIEAGRHEHAPEMAFALATSWRSLQWPAVAIGAASFLICFAGPKLARRLPHALIAVVATTLFVWWMQWPTETIAGKFGAVPQSFPSFAWPALSLQIIRDLAGPVVTIALLGGIESLLSATVADGMTDTRHDSNRELVAQGLANIIAPLFGGFASTGAIARTAANIRAGARTPVSGIVHCAVLLVVALAAGGLAGLIPLAALAGVLMAVAVRMAEWDSFSEVWHSSRLDFAVLAITFVLTVVFDLTAGVGGGLFLAAVLFLRNMESITRVRPLTAETDSEHTGGLSLVGKDVPDGVVLFRLDGPLFFAAADRLEAALRSHTGKPKIVIFRMRHVPFMDVTGLRALEVACEKMRRDGVHVLITSAQPQPMKIMLSSGLAGRLGLDNFCGNIDHALERSRELLDPPLPAA
jgi:SulP family sulfate permease